jgi:hypothetical protein
MPEKRILKGYQVQFHQPDLERLEAFRASQPIKPTMAATVRGLVRLGLAAAADTKRSSIKDTTA